MLVSDLRHFLGIWEDSPYDLRFRRPVAQSEWTSVPVPAEVVATLRGIMVLDSDTERYVFRARATPKGVELLGSIDDLDEAFALLNDGRVEMPDA